MKNIVKISIAAAAFAFALAACTDIENSTGGTGLKEGSDATPEPIALMPLTYTPTKSIVTGTEFPSESAIVAAAWFNTDTGDSTGAKYFENFTFIKGYGLDSGDAGKWGADKTAYWPVKGTLCIMAFRPDTLASGTPNYNAETKVTPTWQDSSTLKLAIEKLREDQDILVGANRAAKKGSDAITFHHINSLIEIQVKSSKDFVKQGSDEYPSGIELCGVIIEDVYKSYDSDGVTITRTAGTNDLTISAGNVTGDNADYTILNKETTTDSLKLSTALRPLDGETANTNHPGGKEPGKRVIVPAQTPTTMTIYYKLYNGSSADASPMLTCDEIPLKISEEEANNKWAAGKKYTYKVTVSADKVTITPSVSDWDNTDKEVTVQSN